MSGIPPGLESTFWLLRAAYPAGLPERDYVPLLLILSDHMSERALGHTIELLFERDRHFVQNDAAAARSSSPPPIPEIERVRNHLSRFGLQEWITESE